MTAMVRTRSIQTQELLLGLAYGFKSPNQGVILSDGSLKHIQGASSEKEDPELKPTIVWEASNTDSSFIYYDTALFSQ